ncbi:MAG: helix-turn-helix transcriptional regulator [Acidobacteriaceae bacterium]|nr:helix-turn-helix transcriptional regulator [Acidobacteriaceae bacterium]
MGVENKAAHITTGDVLEDLGFTPDEIRETEMKMTIWRPLRAEIEALGLSQAEVAGRLQIHQPDASLLLRGRLTKFSVMKLMQLAERLGLTVRLTVKSVAAARSPRPRTSGSTRRRTNSVAAKPKSRTRTAA